MADIEANVSQNDDGDPANVTNARLGDGSNSSMLPGEPLNARRRAFSTTHWSLVLAAGDTQSPQAKEALEKLCRTYWYPLYAYVRRKGYHAHDCA